MSVPDFLQPLFKALDEMEDLVENSKSVWIGKKMVDEDRFFTTSNKLRASLPRDIKQMDLWLKEAARVRQDAEAEAKRIVERAQEYVKELVSEHEVKRKAQTEGERIRDQAQKEAEQIVQQSMAYATAVFERMEKQMEKTLQTVREAIGSLKEKSSEKRGAT